MNSIYAYPSSKSLQSMKNVFLLTSLMSCILSFYFILNFTKELIFSIIVSILTIILLIIYKTKFQNNQKNWFGDEILLCVIMFIMIFHLPFYYLSSSRISFKLPKKDETIIKIDTFLLGWLFKYGQLSIYLDNNNYIGPHTTIGKLINNVLQVFYLFYYIIPYTTLYAISEANCVKEIVYRYINNGHKSYSYNRHWKNAFFMFGVYNITYILVFLINTLVPAGSPRMHLQNEYKHSLNLSGFSKFLNNTCKDDRSANSFPSGHVAETICFAFAFFGVGKKYEGSIFFFCSLMIIFATLFLRYHYFSDVLIALLIAGFGFYFNYYFGYMKDENPTNKKEGKDVIYMINENGEIINNV
mgnify:CR=1 FL=1